MIGTDKKECGGTGETGSPLTPAMLQLSLAAEIAGFDILANVARHLWPPVVASSVATTG